MCSQENDQSRLHNAAHECDKNEVRRLIKSGVDVNAVTKNGMTALHIASQVENYFARDILESLLSAGADVNATTNYGTTALHLAVLSNSVDNAQLLLDHNADINCRDKTYHFTPLHLAAYAGCHTIMKMLLNRGAEADETAKDDVTPLHLASIRGCICSAKILIHHDASVSRLTKSGQYTMLHLALMDPAGDLKKIMNVDDGESELSCRLKAIPLVDFGKRAHFYELLTDHGINVNAKDSSGRTALHIAACNKFSHTVRWILMLGVNIHLKDNDGYLAFHYALKTDNVRGLWDLIQSGTDINDIHVMKTSLSNIMTERPIGNELKRHLVKMKAAKLFIADIYKPFINLCSYNMCYKACLLEVAAMRNNFVVYDEISVYDLLHMMPKSRQKLIGNRQLEFQKFKYVAPMYSGIVEASFREIVYWNSLVRKAIPAFYTIVGLPLPDLCVANIFSYLDSYTLRTIIETIEL